MKNAKIQLSADIKGFKKSVEEAKKAIQGIGSVDISTEAGDKLKKLFGDDLKQKQKQVEDGIKTVTGELNKMAEAGSKAFDPKKYANATKKLGEYSKLLKDINASMDSLSGKSLPVATTGGGGAVSGGVLGRMRGMGGLLGGAAAALGIRSAYNTRVGMAQDRVQLRSLGAGNVNERSQYGFTPSERRQRAIQVARTGTQDVDSITSLSEQVERAFGISQEASIGAVGAAKRAGVEDQGKFLAQTIGAAQAAGIEDSKIGDYLQYQTSFLEEMSKGVNIEESSLRGMAGAFASLPFFKDDPARSFNAMRSLNQSFSGGDRFQQAQALRAIQREAPGASVASMEFRRKMGLFGELDDTTMANLKSAGMSGADLQALGADPSKMVKGIFDEIMTNTKGMRTSDQLFQFMDRTDLDPGAAASIFGQLKSGNFDMGAITDQIKKATMSPEEKLEDVMGSLEGQILDLNSTMSQIGEQIAANIAEPFMKLAMSIDNLVESLGGDPVDVGSGLGTAAVGVAGGLAAARGIKALRGGKGGKGGGKGPQGKMSTKGTKPKVTTPTKLVGRFAKKTASRAIPFLGLGLAFKDAKDLWDKYQKNGELSYKDVAIFGTDVAAAIAGMVPVVGTAASVGLTGASVAMEGMDESSFGGNLFSADTPPPRPKSSGGSVDSGRPAMTPIPNPPPLNQPLPAQGDNTPLTENTKALRSLTTAIRSQRRKFASNNISTGKGVIG